MLGHAFILVGNGDSSCNVRDYGSYAGGETWCAVYINSNANIAETNGLVCVSSLDIYAFIRHMDLPEYRAAIQEAEAVQEQTVASTQELTDLQEQRTELKREIKSLSGASAALKAAERVRVDFDAIRPEKTLTGAVKGVTVEQIRELKAAAMSGAASKQENVELKKENAALRKDKAELQKKVPSIMDRMEAAAKQNQLERLRYENMELKEALEEERSFSDRLLEGIDRVLDMLERHLPKQLLDLVDKARDLLPEHQSYRQEQQREKGHSWGDMSL